MQNFRAELQELVDGVIDAAGDIIEGCMILHCHCEEL